MSASSPTFWSVPFLSEKGRSEEDTLACRPWALVILNQPFSRALLDQLWPFCSWRACADGGANRLYDVLDEKDRNLYLPDLVKGDLDSIRSDVRTYYTNQDISVVEDDDQYATDLMKCVKSLAEVEDSQIDSKYNIIILGGLSGRLDQTMHTISYLLKQQYQRPRMMAVTDESLAWILSPGEHVIAIDREVLGPTCGLLPIGIDRTVLSTTGLEWNLDEAESSFEGLLSTSNHVIADRVWVRTAGAICWTVAVALPTRIER